MTVLQLVERERTRLRRLHVVGGVALALAASLALLAVAAVALGDLRWVRLPRPLPFVVWAALLAANAWVLLRTRRALAREAARGEVAAAIEQEQSLRAGALRGAIEVADAGAFGRRHASDLAARLGGAGPLAPALSARARGRSRRSLAAAAAALLLLVALVPLFGDGLSAALLPVRAWRGTLLPPLRLLDVPREVVRGERIGVVVPAPGRDRVTIAYRLTGQPWRTIEADVDRRTGRALATVGPIDAVTTLVASDGRSSSDTATVRVADRPFVGDVAMRALYPAYLERAPEMLPAGEPVRVPRGTVLEMRGRASTALVRIALVGAGDTVPLRAERHAFSGRFVAARAGTWRWEAAGAAGPIADVPAPLDLDVVPDSAPRVELVAPVADTIVSPSGIVALRVVASDDHGLRHVVLRARRVTASGRELAATEQRVADAPPAPWLGEASIDLGARGLEPGDALRVVVEATDDSPWSQRGASRELVLRVPTLSEQRELARAAADSSVSAVTAAAQEQRRLERETANAARARESREGGDRRNESARSSAGREMSFEGSERARRVLEEQRALQEQVRQAQDAARALEEQLRRAGALDTALARQLAEARELLAQALTPEMERQLRELQEALQQLSGDDARQALSELAEQQRRLREQLERSAEMLKRAALEGAMQTLRDEAREIARRQREIADSLRAGRADSRDATPVAERSERLAEDVAELQRRLDEAKAEAGAQQAESAREHAAASSEAMQRATQQSARPRVQQPGQQQGEQSEQQGQREAAQAQENRDAAASAEQASRAMERAAEELSDARAAQIEEWKSQLSSELDQSVQELTQLAREEQRLEERVRRGEMDESVRAAQSALQQGVERAAERLERAGRKSSLLSRQSQRQVAEAQQKVADATESLSQPGRSSRSAAALGQASEALNRAAASLVRDRERVNSAKSASGFEEMIQQMQELAKQQGQLNARSQGMLGMPSGQGGPGAEQARQLARQQRALAEALDEAARMSDVGAERARQMADEARRIAAALESGRIDQATLARQERLFRRMLDAGKSLEKEEREDADRREARAAEGDERFAPDAADASGAAATRFREPTWEELRGLTPEERSAVIEYFRRINARPAP